MTVMTRIMTPGMLILASATIDILADTKYTRPESIGPVTDRFAAASILNKLRTRGYATSPILFV